MLIDTHAHINFNAYKKDADKVIQRALKNNIWIINVGSQFETSKKAVEIAQKYNNVYAAIGIHPVHLGPSKYIDEEETGFRTKAEKFNREKYKKLGLNKKVVAVGEIGLDYYHIKEENNAEEIKSLQKKAFQEQINLAIDLDKPIIIHCRKAYDDLLKELQFLSPKPKGVIHCFMGRWSQAEKFLEIGFYLGFDGLITYARDYDKVIRNVPLERILVETDSPYLTPVPHRGERNEPLYVKYVAEKIAEIKNVSFNKIAEQTTKNAKNLFNLK